MYENTSALVMTPEGNTDLFPIGTGVLQGDQLAPFLFIICLDYALRTAISPSDGSTLKRRQSSRHPEEVLSDLENADEIALLDNVLKEAEGCFTELRRQHNLFASFCMQGKLSSCM